MDIMITYDEYNKECNNSMYNAHKGVGARYTPQNTVHATQLSCRTCFHFVKGARFEMRPRPRAMPRNPFP